MNTFQTIPNKSGTLFLAGLPIGNNADLTPRVKIALEEADFVLAEDTKRAGINLSRWNIKTKKIIAFHEHNEKEKTPQIIKELKTGKNIALISDAGMPVISDPGYLLVKSCREEDLEIKVLPGPSAPFLALAGSGIAPLPFAFLGFLPRSNNDKENTLKPYAFLPLTLIFFERKDRLYESLEKCAQILGKRDVCICRELTKTHEEFLFFNLENIKSKKEVIAGLLGEITVVLGPSTEKEVSTPDEIDMLINEEKYLDLPPKELAKRVQSFSKGWKIKDIYQRINNIEQKSI